MIRTKFVPMSWWGQLLLFAVHYTLCTVSFMADWSRDNLVHYLKEKNVIWIKRDQLDVTCFIISLFNAQQVSDVNTSILRSLRLICWVISCSVLLWFDVCWCYVVVWLWWCGVRMQAEALVTQPAYGYQVPEDGCINIRNMLSIK